MSSQQVPATARVLSSRTKEAESFQDGSSGDLTRPKRLAYNKEMIKNNVRLAAARTNIQKLQKEQRSISPIAAASSTHLEASPTSKHRRLNSDHFLESWYTS